MAYGCGGPPYLAIIAEHHSQRSVLRLQGELDAGGETHLRRAICAVVGDHPPRTLEMDLSALTFADCAGLAVMVWAHKRLAKRGHELVITGAQPVVQRLLRLTGLDNYLHIRPSRAPGGGICPLPDGALPRRRPSSPASAG